MKRLFAIALVLAGCRPTSVYEPAPPTPGAPDAGAAAEVPMVEREEPDVRGDMPADDIRSVLKAAAPDIGACYRAHPTDGPVPVELQFTIRADGTVESASAEGAPADLAICITGVLLDLRFAAPGATVHVRYPLNLG